MFSDRRYGTSLMEASTYCATAANGKVARDITDKEREREREQRERKIDDMVRKREENRKSI